MMDMGDKVVVVSGIGPGPPCSWPVNMPVPLPEHHWMSTRGNISVADQSRLTIGGLLLAADGQRMAISLL